MMSARLMMVLPSAGVEGDTTGCDCNSSNVIPSGKPGATVRSSENKFEETLLKTVN
jgi:hypothetical protein